MTDEKCQEFFKHFKHSQIYSIGCGNAYPDWLFALGFDGPRRLSILDFRFEIEELKN